MVRLYSGRPELLFTLLHQLKSVISFAFFYSGNPFSINQEFKLFQFFSLFLQLLFFLSVNLFLEVYHFTFEHLKFSFILISLLICLFNFTFKISNNLLILFFQLIFLLFTKISSNIFLKLNNRITTS